MGFLGLGDCLAAARGLPDRWAGELILAERQAQLAEIGIVLIPISGDRGGVPLVRSPAGFLNASATVSGSRYSAALRTW